MEITCVLPDEIFSDNPYILGKFQLYHDNKSKTFEIKKEPGLLSSSHILGRNRSEKERTFYHYFIKFQNCSISDIITKLMTYTNKLSIVSGKMACED